ncbi:NAD(P)-dependent oxidoreductase [Fusibacter ferrireducens]|uniref:Dihydrofolate reductase n=1 Tax=Fusibacter ferrireducens TaxID=2785058 RepID=A0ABR9ZZ07_9FIRM|nr:NAD(P)-dependent oxidoreductase [Fusibacter ferrireducens]MBF4695696.1 dihydrofolate reductase [Fusibacter ferrireducens]
MKALFTYDYGKEQMDKIRALGYKILHIKENDIPDRQSEIIDFDPNVIVCYNPFEHLPIEALTNLKWIQLSSIGVDQVPVDRIVNRGIVITNNRGGYSIPMGEWIVFQMLHHYKYGQYFHQIKSEKRWKVNTHVRELTHRKALFIGTGTIASEAAKRLSGYDLTRIGINTDGREVPYFDKCYPMTALDEVLSEMDFIILTIPYTKKTEGLICKERLSLIKEDAVLINVARGNLIIESDLIEALDQGKFLGVSLDVFEKEPLEVHNKLWSFDRVMVTPHNSWISEMRNVRRFDLIYNNLKAFCQESELENQVDLNKGY